MHRDLICVQDRESRLRVTCVQVCPICGTGSSLDMSTTACKCYLSWYCCSVCRDCDNDVTDGCHRGMIHSKQREASA
jgi:hypothetical protein